MAIIIPDIILLNTLEAILKLIRVDYESYIDKTKSYLYRILENNTILQRYNFYEQAKTVFIGEDDSSRKLDVFMFFNKERSSIPTIHLMLDNEITGENALSISQGFQETIFNDVDSTYREVYSRRFDTEHQILITSNNANEVLLIYHYLRAFLIPIFDHLNASGLENCKLNGRDLNLDQNILPNVYSRTIGISYSYDVNVQKLFDDVQISSLIFNSMQSLGDESESTINTFGVGNSEWNPNEQIIVSNDGANQIFTLKNNFLEKSTMLFLRGSRLRLEIDYIEIRKNKIQVLFDLYINDDLYIDYVKIT